MTLDLYYVSGEKLSDDEVDALLQGVEDSQGQVNYEGWSLIDSRFINSWELGIHVYLCQTDNSLSINFCQWRILLTF